MPDSHPHMQPLDLVEQLELSPSHRKCRQDKLSTMLSRRDRPGGGGGQPCVERGPARPRGQPPRTQVLTPGWGGMALAPNC